MLLFIIYRFLTWRAHYKTFVGYNQYVALIINLLAADLLQGVAFMFSYHWVFTDGIVAPSVKCTSQGFLLNAGQLLEDLLSYAPLLTYIQATCLPATL